MITIRSLADALRTGTTTSVALVETALARITAHRNGGGTAYLDVDGEQALLAARASDEARARGDVPSLLAGLPVSIKDLFDVAGQVTTAGSTVLADRPPASADAVTVARLRKAGAILLGRTNMTEFAFSALGLNPHYGTPRNPVDPERVVGGSTSGGAVSVALDMAVLALGTDTGGSIRIPAAFCGVTGFKPTARRIDLTGAIPLSPSLDSAGPLARSVDCCAIADAILSNQHLDTTAARAGGLRLGVTTDLVGEQLDEAVEQAFENALAALARAGANIQRFSFPELKQLPTINRGGGFAAAESWTWHRELLERCADRYDPRVATRIRRGSQQTPADYRALLDARLQLQEDARRRLAPFDAWLMPTIAIMPPRLDTVERDDELFFARNGEVLRNPSVVNFLDGCALTLPCPVPAGQLPVGLAICGQQGQDARILQVGRAVESALRES